MPPRVRDWREQEAANQTTFRELNEWTEEANDAVLDIDRPADWYLCECSNAKCTDLISLSRPEYEAVRAMPNQFAIAVSHENPEIDQVVSENQRFAVVKKVTRAAVKIARASDPRR